MKHRGSDKNRQQRPKRGTAKHDAPRRAHAPHTRDGKSRDGKPRDGKPHTARPTGDRRPPQKQAAERSAPSPQRRERRERPAPKRHVPLPANIFYGIHACLEALRNKKRNIQHIYIGADLLNRHEELTAAIRQRKCPVDVFEDKEDFEKLGLRESVHQNIALKVQELEQPSIEALIHQQADQAQSVMIMLDQVTDPHNIGAIMRSASAFGACGLIVQERHAPEINGTIAKIACGAVEHLPYLQETNLSRTLRVLQDNGYHCIGLDERGEKTMSQSLGKNRKIVIVLGAEGAGLRRLVAETCDTLARLPTVPPILSLNVSNAAAVALYATLSQDA